MNTRIIFILLLSLIIFVFIIKEKFTENEEFDVQVIKNFLDDKEILSILGDCNNFYDSKTISRSGNKTSDYRTSTTCSLGRNSISHNLIGEKLKVFGFESSKLETLQLTKYLEGQYYKEHYDYFNERNPVEFKHIKSNGQRLYTIFVYLKVPDEGGETNFPKIGKKFKLNKGDALLWKNCEKTSNGYKYILESKHEGLPVTKGTKIGMNVWITDRQ
tara:strand:- start:7 stop:654 length:648 start_codon:yes stop_codon:yes gene_type:complete